MNATRQAKTRKTLLSAGLGFIAGIGGVLGFYALGADLDWGGGRAPAAAIGVVYLATGLFTLLGTMAPGLGAKVLNVADAEELVEQRAILLGSSASMIALGLMLLSLAGAGPGGFIRDEVAMAMIAIALIGATVVSVRQWRLYDELWRQLSWEGSAYAMGLVLPLMVIWGAAVHLGYVASMDPLAVIAMVLAAVLAGAFIATGRRGLLTPR